MSNARTQFKIIFDREIDGRWIAEIPRVPEALAYDVTRTETKRKASATTRLAPNFG